MRAFSRTIRQLPAIAFATALCAICHAQSATAQTLGIAESMAEARAHLVANDYAQGIQIYNRLLQEPDTGHHRLALEYLGVAREKSGRLDLAKSHYEMYLDRFPAGADAERVRQRLAVLLVQQNADAAAAAPRESLRRAGSDWRVHGAVSQDYLRDSNRWREDAEQVVAQSALLTLADLAVSRRGARFDVAARVNAGFQKDLLKEDVGPGDQGLVSNAFIEVRDQRLGWNARAGRQSLHTDGVLGRFDGLRASYRWRHQITFNATAGSPVDSPRYLADTNRQFVGASVNFEDLLDGLDLSAFTHQQRNDGIWDRQAVGGEARYRSAHWNVLGSVDYDVSYGVLNSALLIASLRLNDRLEIHARANAYALPYLTSRNALIGQPTSTIDGLLQTYSEPQIRTLARDRTADALTGSFGIAATLSDSWYFNGTLTYSQVDGTLDSGGVAAIPDSGTQLYYAASLIGSSVIRRGDTTIVGYRLNSSESADTNTLLFDLRLPFGKSFRVGPRLALSMREAGQQGDQQWIAEPSIRFTYRAGQRYRLELEAGGRWSQHELPDQLLVSALYPDDREESLGYYFNLRWGLDF